MNFFQTLLTDSWEFTKYQKILRLYEGRNILRSGRKTVSGAAFEVGYASSSHFTNDYRKFFGLSPRDDARAGFAS